MSDPRRQVLIVDDDEEIREVVAEMCKQLDFTTTSVSSAAEARTALESSVPDLIILDIMMPGGNGLDLCRWVRAQPRLAAVPVLLNSGLKDEETVQDALELGAVDFLQKPYKLEALKEKISRYGGKPRA